MEPAQEQAQAPAPETVNNIVLTDEQMLFYNLNVIHDIIHDYGFYASETRWTKNANYARQFLPGRYTMTFDYTDDKEANVKNANVGEEDLDGGMSGGVFTPPTDKKRTNDDINLNKESDDAPSNARMRPTPTDNTDGTNSPIPNINQGLTRSPLIKTPVNITISPNTTTANFTQEINRTDNVKNNNQILNFSLQTDLNDEKKTKQIIYSEYLEFIEQIKNATMFNFFGFITSVPSSSSSSSSSSNVSLLTSTDNKHFNCYKLAYDIIVPVDPEEYETEEAIGIGRGGGNIQSNQTPPLFELYCAIADDFGDYLFARYGQDITIEPIKNIERRNALIGTLGLKQATAQATTNSTKTDIFRLFDDLSNFLDTDIILNNNSVDV